MFEAYYNLRADPFHLAPDPSFRFAHKGYARVFARLEDALRQREPLVVVTGEPGTGKTLLLNELLAGCMDGHVSCARLTAPDLDREELLRAVALEFGLAGCERAGPGESLQRIKEFLLHEASGGRRCILAIDEAQETPPDAIAQAAELSGLRGADGHRLLQVVLSGQPSPCAPEFADRLGHIDTACELAGMDGPETGMYVEHRLRCAGWQGDPAITAPALQAIHALSRGVPRRVNQICGRLLLFGAFEGKHVLDVSDAAGVAADLCAEGLLEPGCLARLAALPPLRPEAGPATDAPVQQPQGQIPGDIPKRQEPVMHEAGTALPPAAENPQPAAGAPSVIEKITRRRGGAKKWSRRSAAVGSLLLAVAVFSVSYPGGLDLFWSRFLGDPAGTVTAQVAAIGKIFRFDFTPPGVREGIREPDEAEVGSWNDGSESESRQSAQVNGDKSRGGAGSVRQPRAQTGATGSIAAQSETKAPPPSVAGAERSTSANERPRGDTSTLEATRVEHPDTEQRPEPKRPTVAQRDVAPPPVVERPPVAPIEIERPEAELPELPKVERPEVERPVADRPVVERPDVESPPVERPEIERPEVERPEVERPGAERPDVERPDVARPEIERPEVERPEVERPEAERPEVERPEVERPEVERPDVERPEVERPEVERPEVERPEVERPEVERPDVERPEVERPEVERPEVERPEVERPDVERPEVERPEVERPEVERPEVERPEVERPEVERPEVERPEVERPGVERPDVERPDVERPNVERPEIDRPEAERPHRD